MTSAGLHHACVRVTNIEESARFYVEAFDGQQLTRPFLLEGASAEDTTGGPPGVRFKICHVGFARGAVELFEFVEPVHEFEVLHFSRANTLHFALQVDDVAEALRRVESAGGRRLWPQISEWDTAHFMYVADLDGNVVELVDATSLRIAEITGGSYPESRVEGAHEK
jgi:catechol 2,3-dioxygenase-like lactoylglutathione lyase family enzyme